MITASSACVGKVEHPSPGVSMRKADEIVMVIAAARLTAAVALMDIPEE